MNDIAQIEKAEARLRTAMLASDISALEKLLSPDVVFTNQVGARLRKADDIAVHQSGLLRIDKIDQREELLIRLLGDSAIVCVTVDLSGSFDRQTFGGAFAYSRVWHRRDDGQWQVEAAHCSPVGHG